MTSASLRTRTLDEFLADPVPELIEVWRNCRGRHGFSAFIDAPNLRKIPLDPPYDRYTEARTWAAQVERRVQRIGRGALKIIQSLTVGFGIAPEKLDRADVWRAALMWADGRPVGCEDVSNLLSSADRDLRLAGACLAGLAIDKEHAGRLIGHKDAQVRSFGMRVMGRWGGDPETS